MWTVWSGLVWPLSTEVTRTIGVHCTALCSVHSRDESCVGVSLEEVHTSRYAWWSLGREVGVKRNSKYIHVTQIKSDPEVVRLIAHINTRLVK